MRYATELCQMNVSSFTDAIVIFFSTFALVICIGAEVLSSAGITPSVQGGGRLRFSLTYFSLFYFLLSADFFSLYYNRFPGSFALDISLASLCHWLLSNICRLPSYTKIFLPFPLSPSQ